MKSLDFQLTSFFPTLKLHQNGEKGENQKDRDEYNFMLMNIKNSEVTTSRFFVFLIKKLRFYNFTIIR